MRYYSAVKLERRGGRLFAKCSALSAAVVVVAVIQGSTVAQDRSPVQLLFNCNCNRPRHHCFSCAPVAWRLVVFSTIA